MKALKASHFAFLYRGPDLGTCLLTLGFRLTSANTNICSARNYLNYVYKGMIGAEIKKRVPKAY